MLQEGRVWVPILKSMEGLLCGGVRSRKRSRSQSRIGIRGRRSGSVKGRSRTRRRRRRGGGGVGLGIEVGVRVGGEASKKIAFSAHVFIVVPPCESVRDVA